jgi:hypothetical protein
MQRLLRECTNVMWTDLGRLPVVHGQWGMWVMQVSVKKVH